MADLDTITLVRSILLAATTTCFVLFTLRYFRAFTVLSLGQKLCIGSMLMFMITVMWDTAIFIERHDYLSGRIFPYSVGVVLCFAYLAEPTHLALKRKGLDVFECSEPPDEQTHEVRSLRTQRAELRDQVYDLAIRNNNLQRRIYQLESGQTDA